MVLVSNLTLVETKMDYSVQNNFKFFLLYDGKVAEARPSDPDTDGTTASQGGETGGKQ